MCVKHLSGSLRVVVAFENPQRGWALLCGPHDDKDAILDIYAQLYRLLGIEVASDAGRSKPPCCDPAEQLPPVLGEALAGILEHAAKPRRTKPSSFWAPQDSKSPAGSRPARPEGTRRSW